MVLQVHLSFQSLHYDTFFFLRDSTNVKKKFVENLVYEKKWYDISHNMDKLDVYKQLKHVYEPEKYLVLNIDK